jgi:hypothetical protein
MVGCVCVHMGECSYVYEYLHLYYISQKNYGRKKKENNFII